MYAQESIDLLRNSGIKFEMHEERGIDVTTPPSHTVSFCDGVRLLRTSSSRP